MHALRGIQRPTWNVSNQPKNGFDRCVIIYTSSASAELDGVPKTSVDFLGERRHMSPNDALRHSLRPCCRTRASKTYFRWIYALRRFNDISHRLRSFETVRRALKNSSKSI